MPRLRKDANLTKPWKAEVKIDYQIYYLGYHATKAEAEADERAFRLEHTGREAPGHNDCSCHRRTTCLGS